MPRAKSPYHTWIEAQGMAGVGTHGLEPEILGGDESFQYLLARLSSPMIFHMAFPDL